MRVHLVCPTREGISGPRPGVAITPPLGLAALAAVTPPHVQVTISDENVRPVDFEQAGDLVGITANTQTVTRAYAVADRFRAKGVPVVMGGIHVTALPEEAAQHADAVVLGEAEEIWPALLADFEAGGLRPLYRCEQRPSLAGLPPPRRDLFRRRSYLIPDTFYTTRGCPFDCTYCAVTSFFGGSYRMRPVEEVIREVDGLGGRRLAMIVDDNVCGHFGYARRLFGALASRKIGWIGQASVTVARDDSMLAMLAASGCQGLFLGIESVFPSSLRAVGKVQNDVEAYEAAIRRIHAHGIAIEGGFMFGLEHDTEDVFEETVRFAQRTRLEAAHFSIVTPYPSTPLFASLQQQGRILTTDWEQYREDHVVHIPMNMSMRRLLEGREWAWREFYSLRSIRRRIGFTRPYFPVLWAMNLQYRNDRVSRFFFDRMATWVSSFL